MTPTSSNVSPAKSAFSPNVAEASDSDDEDEIADEERLNSLKAMLFDTYCIQNIEALQVDDFVADLEFIFRTKRTSENDHSTLYHTLLNLK